MKQDELYLQAVAKFGPALVRLARAYEADSDQRRDLLQDIHFALWRSFSSFAEQCSLTTWVYRVAHNTAISNRVRRRKAQLISLEDLAEIPAPDDPEQAAGNARAIARLQTLIRCLAPPDDQVMLLYLEYFDAASIAEITGLSARAVATRIHQAAVGAAVWRGKNAMSDFKSVWKDQPVEEHAMITLSEIHARAERFRAHVQWRNIALYVYSFLNIAISIWLISSGRFDAFKYPMLLMIAAHVLVLWQINQRIASRTPPGDLGARAALDFHRRELERQEEGMTHAWLWYIAPFMPAFIWELAIWLQRIQSGQAPSYRFFLFTVISAALFWTAVYLAFSRAGVRARLQIEHLKALKAE